MMKKLITRVDAGTQIGMRHLMCCVATDIPGASIAPAKVLP